MASETGYGQVWKRLSSQCGPFEAALVRDVQTTQWRRDLVRVGRVTSLEAYFGPP